MRCGTSAGTVTGGDRYSGFAGARSALVPTARTERTGALSQRMDRLRLQFELTLLDFVDLVRDEAVGFLVNPGCSFCIRGMN
jgi:hypothetical protein